MTNFNREAPPSGILKVSYELLPIRERLSIGYHLGLHIFRVLFYTEGMWRRWLDKADR